MKHPRPKAVKPKPWQWALLDIEFPTDAQRKAFEKLASAPPPRANLGGQLGGGGWFVRGNPRRLGEALAQHAGVVTDVALADKVLSAALSTPMSAPGAARAWMSAQNGKGTGAQASFEGIGRTFRVQKAGELWTASLQEGLASNRPTASPIVRSVALKSWLELAPLATRKRFQDALERATSSSKHVAGVAVGGRRLEIRTGANGWTVVDFRSGQEAAFVKKERFAPRRRLLNNETPAQAKQRGLRDLVAGEKKKAAAARKQARADLGRKAKDTRKERGAKLAGARATCKIEIGDARQKAPKPARRVAAATVRIGCAEREQRIEADFSAQFQAISAGIDKLREDHLARRPMKAIKANAPKKREAKKERDEQIRDELSRLGRADLIDVWNREKDAPAYRGLSFDRTIERFIEAVEENEEMVSAAQERAENVDPRALACEEAQHLAAEGNPDAQSWAELNCDGARPKGSVHSRTGRMFGIEPPDPAKAPARKREAKSRPNTGPLRGQQTIGVGHFGRSILGKAGKGKARDAQIPF